MSWCEEYAQNDPSIGKASVGDQPITVSYCYRTVQCNPCFKL